MRDVHDLGHVRDWVHLAEPHCDLLEAYGVRPVRAAAAALGGLELGLPFFVAYKESLRGVILPAVIALGHLLVLDWSARHGTRPACRRGGPSC